MTCPGCIHRLSGHNWKTSFVLTPEKKNPHKTPANTFSVENHKNTSVSRKSFIQKSITASLCYLKLNWECIQAVIMEFVSTVICLVVFGPYIVIAMHDNNPRHPCIESRTIAAGHYGTFPSCICLCHRVLVFLLPSTALLFNTVVLLLATILLFFSYLSMYAFTPQSTFFSLHRTKPSNTRAANKIFNYSCQTSLK